MVVLLAVLAIKSDAVLAALHVAVLVAVFAEEPAVVLAAVLAAAIALVLAAATAAALAVLPTAALVLVLAFLPSSILQYHQLILLPGSPLPPHSTRSKNIQMVQLQQHLLRSSRPPPLCFQFNLEAKLLMLLVIADPLCEVCAVMIIRLERIALGRSR